MRTALSIAGSDPSGGAGIQADIKTMMANGVYAMAIVTAVTAQNTRGVSAVMEIPPDFVGRQMDSVFGDIFPDAVKLGMVPSAETAGIIAGRLERYRARHVVADPVMASTGGTALAGEGAVRVFMERLFPLAELVTPNIPEARILSGLDIEEEGGRESMERAARAIGDACGCAVLLKGGHGAGPADDLLYAGGRFTWFTGERIANPNTHGTGCTLSSAIAANLARGYALEESVGRAKEYVAGAIRAMLDLGGGSGPLDHSYNIDCE